MFKIGEFSRLTRVPITTLHHYDEIGLFTPVQSDPFTGYRYYSFDQLPRLNRILALRGLGFTLDQIGTMLGDGAALAVSADELRGMLMLRKAELEQQVEAAREALAQVEVRLYQIEREGTMPDLEILIKPVEAVSVAGAREVVPQPSLMRERCIALDRAACALIAAAKLELVDGTSLALYYGGEESRENGIDVEMAYAVVPPSAPPAATQPNAQVHTLPAATVAYAVYHGSYDDFGAVGQVHAALTDWIAANGYRIAGACREYYLRPPQSAADPVGVMEIQYPVER